MDTPQPPKSLTYIRSFSNSGINNTGTALAFAREVQVAEQIRGHSKVNRFEWASMEDPLGVLWLEYCDLGPIHTFHDRAKHNRSISLPQGFLFSAMKDIASALCWLHFGIKWQVGCPLNIDPKWNPVTHNDLHDANIFVTSVSSHSRYPTAVLGDFGNATSRRHAGLARADERLLEMDSFMIGDHPPCDILMFGRCFSYLAGDLHIYSRDFKIRALDELLNSGISRYLTRVLEECLTPESKRCRSFELCNLVHKMQTCYHDKYGPPKALPPHLLPISKNLPERQPNGRPDWGRGNFATHAPQQRPQANTEDRCGFQAEIRRPKASANSTKGRDDFERQRPRADTGAKAAPQYQTEYRRPKASANPEKGKDDFEQRRPRADTGARAAPQYQSEYRRPRGRTGLGRVETNHMRGGWTRRKR